MPWAPSASWWWVIAVGGSRAVQPAGAARASPRAARGCCCAVSNPARHPRGGSGPSAAVDGGAARRVQRRDLADRLVAGAVRACPGRQGRRGRRPALAARRSPACSSWAAAAAVEDRGGPVRALAGRRPSGDRRRQGRRGTPSSAPAACCSPVPGSASGPRWRRGIGRDRGRSRPASAGRARPRTSSSARPSATGRSSGRSARTGGLMYGVTGVALSAMLPAVAAAVPALLVTSLPTWHASDASRRGPARRVPGPGPGHARLRAGVRRC
jgi:hypothetical protein